MTLREKLEKLHKSLLVRAKNYGMYGFDDEAAEALRCAREIAELLAAEEKA